MAMRLVKPQVTEPDVFDFHDYREYLKQVFAFLKSENNLSVRKFAQLIGVSHGYFTLVLRNQRTLSPQVLHKLTVYLELNDSEARHLENLIELADTKDINRRNAAFKKLKRQTSFKENFKKEVSTYRYLESWLHVVIRELAQTEGFRPDPEWIKLRLPWTVRIPEIVQALEFLFTNGFLIVDPQQRVQVAEKDLSCLGGVYQLSLGNFHHQMLGLAQKAIVDVPKHRRKQIGYTMAIAQEDFVQVQAILEEARNKIKELEKQCSNVKDAVYHINFSAFPLAGKGDDEQDS